MRNATREMTDSLENWAPGISLTRPSWAAHDRAPESTASICSGSGWLPVDLCRQFMDPFVQAQVEGTGATTP